MKFKLLFIFTLFFSALPLCAMDHEKKDWDKLLFRAVQSHNIEQVKKCISEGANVNAADEKGRSILSSVGRDYKIIKLLLDKGTRVHDDLILIRAAYVGDAHIVKVLLDHGVPINRDDDEWTALTFAIAKYSSHIVNILLKHSAYIDLTKPSSAPPLSYAITGQTKIIELLLKYINHILDKTDDPGICQKWDQYILDALNEGEKEWNGFDIKTINAFRLILHHASKLPLSTKKLESLTAKTLGAKYGSEYAFIKTIKHLRKHAF